jgi:hypothetical protein
MKKIVRIHEKILDHLIGLRKIDPNLFFVPRKINNKNRLQTGYWFLGDDNYLHLSFWNGTDWKEKINNIGLVIFEDKTSYIELSAQDSTSKAKFLEKIALSIPGFEKDKSKNKWYKHYDGKDYLANLNDFIQNIRPQIDSLVKKNKPDGIELLNRDFFNQYCKKIIDRRKMQITLGKTNKISRICWNTENWKFPSGPMGKSFSTDSYENESGYGHEEWLFDKTKIVAGFHYSFLQPLLLKSGKHDNEIYDVCLFTMNNLKKQYYVAEIKDLICITEEESKRIYQIYKNNGWLDKMRNEVGYAGANTENFSLTTAETFFNIKFDFKNVDLVDELIEISDDDINITTNRYKLLPRKSDLILATLPDEEDDEDEGNKKNTNTRKKVYKVDCEFDPYHDQMQNAIFELLKDTKTYEYKKVIIEKGRVDIKAKTQMNTWHFFELKTDNPKISRGYSVNCVRCKFFTFDYEKTIRTFIGV